MQAYYVTEKIWADGVPIGTETYVSYMRFFFDLNPSTDDIEIGSLEIYGKFYFKIDPEPYAVSSNSYFTGSDVEWTYFPEPLQDIGYLDHIYVKYWDFPEYPESVYPSGIPRKVVPRLLFDERPIDTNISVKNLMKAFEDKAVSADLISTLDVFLNGSKSDYLYLSGSDLGDRLTGSAGDDFGKDRLFGKGGNDVLIGYRGADLLYGGNGDDILRAGNGRDIITGGAGSDTMYGGFGLNTFEDKADGAVDTLYFKSDQWAENWIYGKAGNSPNGQKADKITELDSFDRIYVQGVATSQLSFRAVSHQSNLGETLSGVGIYASGYLEAVYVGDNLSLGQISAMTQGVLL